MAYILGRKVGMTRVFNANGDSVPVTVIEAGPCTIIQKKSKAKEGYDAIQVGFSDKKVRGKRNNDGRRRRNKWPGKALAGHFAKAGTPAFEYVREFKVDKLDEWTVGQELTVAQFHPGDRVDVHGVSKGKGFAGTVKRHGFGGGPETHGSMSHRAPGSIGSNTDPSRVFPGMRMAGHMGDANVTSRNLEIVTVDTENGLLLVKGAAPGARRAFVRIEPTTHRHKTASHESTGQKVSMAARREAALKNAAAAVGGKVTDEKKK